jgi:hypothetical protein
MIHVGIDDTDVLGAPGTNQFARAFATHVTEQFECVLIVRHQLLQDPRVPCTSKNSAASLLMRPRDGSSMETLAEQLRAFVRRRFVAGSDPGICVTTKVPEALTVFARRCQRELVAQREARRLAERSGVYLRGCGGTDDGVIGALAAVGLAAEGNDGRVVQIGAWPDDLSGPQNIQTLVARDVEVRCLESKRAVRAGLVDVGKHLRPNYRERRIVLFARRAPHPRGTLRYWQAVRLT